VPDPVPDPADGNQQGDPLAGRDRDEDGDVIRRLEGAVSRKRLWHCRRVAELAESLATRWELDARLARRAGLLHDVCRANRPEWDALAARAGLTLPAWAGGERGLLHGPLGAIVAREEFDLPEAWCQAIAGHTTGGPEMTPEEMVLFVADRAAVGREEPRARARRDLAHEDLTAATLATLADRLGDLLASGAMLWPPTVRARNDLLARRAAIEASAALTAGRRPGPAGTASTTGGSE
jgi:predicted HD superfamily hydrolase involved in NAD metabolism